MTARIVDKEQKKREIASAAMTLFAESGFEATSMRQVAGAAGIGKGTIYEYFPSKDELIATSIRLWMDQMIRNAEEAFSGIDDPKIRLKAYVQSLVDIFLSDERMPRLIVSIFQIFMTRLHDTNYGDTLRVMFQTGVDSIKRILVEGMETGAFKIDSQEEAEKIAVNLTAFLDGICLDYLATGGAFDLKEQVDHYLKYLLEANLK